MEKRMKVVFWGAGKYADRVMKMIQSDGETYQDVYEVIVDSNTARRGEYFNGLKVITPAELQNYEYDIIAITSIYEKEIRAQMRRNLNILEERIYSASEYLGFCLTRQVYKNRYKNGGEYRKKNAFDLKKIVVYTAIIDEYDDLKDPLFQSDGIEYVCFTNNARLKSKNWNIQLITSNNMDAVHLARHIKLSPHIYCTGYETSIWVDGKYQIKDDLRKYVIQYQGDKKVLCFPHYERKCIIDEAAMCTILHRGNKKDMFFQVVDYLRAGYPVDNGLYDTGCIVRAHNDLEIVELMKMWEGEINRYSIRDQLSFPYVCWKMGVVPDVCDLLIDKNPWLQLYYHNYSK